MPPNGLALHPGLKSCFAIIRPMASGVSTLQKIGFFRAIYIRMGIIFQNLF